MKRNRFVFKIDRNGNGKIYINGKWQKYVSELDIIGRPHDYIIKIKQYKKNDKGQFYVKNNEIAYEEKEYHFLD